MDSAKKPPRYAIARQLRPTDFRDAESEYPIQSREDYEAGIEVAYIEAQGVIDALRDAGYTITQTQNGDPK